MKKLVFLMVPFMALFFLASCNKNLGTPMPLEECSWEKISQVSKAGKASKWFKVGDTKTIKVNDIDQKVRIIDFNHDRLAGGGKAGITFEFVNILSDSDGYSLSTPWNWENGCDSPNYDFLNSTLRKALDGEGDAELFWYQIHSETRSTKYTTSALNMLPKDLKSVLKKVKKPITIGEKYKESSYSTKLFVLSSREMTEGDISKYAKDEGETYTFYKDDGDTDDNRIKHQIKWHDGAITLLFPTIKDGKYNATTSYAGYNSNNKITEGGASWLRSPNIDNSSLKLEYPPACVIESDGHIVNSVTGCVFDSAYGVVPAFCV